MFPAETCYLDQLARIDRLMHIIASKDPHSLCGCLPYHDIVIFTCQCMWHLKDWLLNDPEFGAKDSRALKRDIHSERCLLICSDLANGSKHLAVHSPKTGFSFYNRGGVHIDYKEGVFEEYFCVVCDTSSDPFHGMEIRELLMLCREAWDRIIDKHYLSEVDF